MKFTKPDMQERFVAGIYNLINGAKVAFNNYINK